MQKKPASLKKPPSAESGNKRIPRYAWLHQCLLNDIETGKYPVGSYLPTEEQLALAYDVSRHTVREATRRLAEKNMIVRSAGAGTVVTSAAPVQNPPVFASTFGSMSDLKLYTAQTRLEILGQENITASNELANKFHITPGENIIFLPAYRRLVENDLLISYSHIYLNPDFGNLINRLKGNHPSIFDLIQQEYGREIVKVTQEVEASHMPEKARQALQLAPNSLALRVIRVYFDNNRRLMAASDNFYIENKFRLITSWQKGNE